MNYYSKRMKSLEAQRFEFPEMELALLMAYGSSRLRIRTYFILLWWNNPHLMN